MPVQSTRYSKPRARDGRTVPLRLIWTESDLERSLSDQDNYFLSPDTRQFFKTRVGKVYPLSEAKTMFQVSDKSPSGRVHSVHIWDAEQGEVETIYKQGTSAGATKAFKNAIKTMKEW